MRTEKQGMINPMLHKLGTLFLRASLTVVVQVELMGSFVFHKAGGPDPVPYQQIKPQHKTSVKSIVCYLHSKSQIVWGRDMFVCLFLSSLFFFLTIH